MSSIKELAFGALVLWLFAVVGEMSFLSAVEALRFAPSLSSIYGDFSARPFRSFQGLSTEELKGFDLFADCSDSHEHWIHSSALFVLLKHFFNDLFGDILFQQVYSKCVVYL